MKSYFENIKKSFKLKHYSNYICITAFFALFVVLYYAGALNRSTPNLLTQIGYSVILAVSLNLVVGFLGELSLGHAGFMCIGAYFGTFLSNLMLPAVPLPIALIVSMLAGGTLAALFGFVVGLPALRLRGDYLAIVTLAFGEIVRNVCMNLPFFGGALGIDSEYYSAMLTADGKKFPLFIPTFIMVLFMLVVLQNVIRSKHGRAITAIRDNEIAAKSMGVNVTYYKLFAFVLSAFFAGIAGVLFGANVSPVTYGAFSYNYSIEILVMVVLGGMGSVNGSIIAATLITYINFLLTKSLSGDMAAVKNIVYAVILIVIVIYKNAPALKKYRDRFDFRVLLTKLKAKFVKADPSQIIDDRADWDQVPTKIITDEILSTDLSLDNYNPDKPDDLAEGDS